MPAFYRSTVSMFLALSESEMLGLLTLGYANQGFTDLSTAQILTWSRDYETLQSSLGDVVRSDKSAGNWNLLLEFAIPRKEKRIDVVLLIASTIVILEFKTGALSSTDVSQVEEYALLLHYFHAASHRRKIISLLVGTNGVPWSQEEQAELAFEETPRYWIPRVQMLSREQLGECLLYLSRGVSDAPQIIGSSWEIAAYQPVPSIIDAARSLQMGLKIGEIARSEAAQHDIEDLTSYLLQAVDSARKNRRRAIFFVTGVPGSGKTLVGLNLAYSEKSGENAIHFMSGNGPLVLVLQEVLKRFQMGRGHRALDAKIQAKTLIENVHVFARTYTDELAGQVPSNHVVIFDEAQRAWDKTQNLRKFKRDYSEPEMLLRIMERHEDWAVIIALVGGGQEINSGEAGLAEWGRSLANSNKAWEVFSSPVGLDGGEAVAGGRLGDLIVSADCHVDPRLHLNVSLRSLRAERFATWANFVLEGNATAAYALNIGRFFSLFMTRDLNQTRELLRKQAFGGSRYGLVGSSSAARLRAEGLEPDSSFHANYKWEHWYLAASTDVRSSSQLEVFATEFEIQGLELDWVGLCWGGDMVWSERQSEWLLRQFSHKERSSWSVMKNEARRLYRKNAYRVLLTRARQGLVIYVPKGNATDSTQTPADFDTTAEFLIRCGVKQIEG
jgi:hypothetical protein